jgi:hypothetical protein
MPQPHLVDYAASVHLWLLLHPERAPSDGTIEMACLLSVLRRSRLALQTLDLKYVFAPLWVVFGLSLCLMCVCFQNDGNMG